MATQSWAHNFDHDGDAGFQAWGDDLNTRLDAVGLVQTADTGQIDWSTVSRPSFNTMAGYEIWRFDDALQGTAPIFLRFDFGTDNEADRPRIEVTVGTGSNGSGTLTGTVTSAYEITAGDGNTDGTAAQSFLCHVDGFLGLVWGRNGPEANLNWGTFHLCRSCDSSGDPTASGAFVMYQNGPVLFSTTVNATMAAHASIDFANSTVWEAAAPASTAFPACCLIPGTVGNITLPNGDTPVWLLWGAKPDAFPVFGLCVVHEDHVSETGTFSASPVGATSRTFINVGAGGFNNIMFDAQSTELTAYDLCMVWE
jgi:hypothetical protein